MATRNIIALIGARQVGKTTMIEQSIEDLLLETDPRRILLIIGDNSELNTISENPIDECLHVYEKYILREDLNKISDKVYIIIDEIQRIEKWADKIKSWYSINKNIKFLVSGSSSTKILNDSTKPFVGRVTYQIVVPFKLLENIRYVYTKSGNDDKLNEIRIFED